MADRALTDLVTLALDRVTGGRAIPGNRVALRNDGPEIFDAALAAIAGATRWIHFDNYIFRPDRTGTRFAEALRERARAGVRVRVLTDWLGSAGTPRDFWGRMRRDGVEVRLFGPPRLLDPGTAFVRNHRKLIVVDGGRALTGGFCIADEWAGDPDRGRQPWRETAVEVWGPAAAALDRAFAHLWARTGPPLPHDELVGEVAAAGDTPMRVVAGIPGRDRMYRTMDLVLSSATRRFWVTDAYFVAPRRLFQSLLDAANDGVDVRLLVPGSSDLPWIRNLTRFGYRDLLRAGVRIFEWQGPMLHAKAVVSDGRWSRIGSSNLNPSSLFGNWELDVLVDDPEFASILEHQFRRDQELSAEVRVRPILPAAVLGAAQPTALAIARTGEHPVSHRPGSRERRRRGLLVLWTLVRSARLATFGSLALVLLVAGTLSLLLPRTTSLVLGVVFLLAAAGTGIHALRRADRG